MYKYAPIKHCMKYISSSAFKQLCLNGRVIRLYVSSHRISKQHYPSGNNIRNYSALLRIFIRMRQLVAFKLANNSFICNLYPSFIKQFFVASEPAKHLGRWRVEDCNIRINKKIDFSNEDHCGACTTPDSEKDVYNNKSSS